MFELALLTVMVILAWVLGLFKLLAKVLGMGVSESAFIADRHATTLVQRKAELLRTTSLKADLPEAKEFDRLMEDFHSGNL